MRLICGIVRLDRADVEDAALHAMARAMTAPGLTPRVSSWRAGPAGLAVLDFQGRGAGLAERPGWIAAADARLDRNAADPEAAIVDAFERHGPDFPDRLDGDFAVALWRPDRQELWLGRDYIGVRPLAWTWRPGRWLAFASLPKGLHGAGLAATTIDPPALANKVLFQYFAGPDSGFAEIAYLQAGHSLCVRPDDAAAPVPHRAYRPDPALVGCWRGSRDAAATTLRTLVQDAVAARLPASGAIACHLTGGLDSSAITVLAARAGRTRGSRVLALSTMAEQALGPAELDERPLIAAVLEQEPDLAHVVLPDATPLPGPPPDPDWPGSGVDGAVDPMMAAAAGFGADRVLSGIGGDEGASYNGAQLYARLLLQGHVRTLLRELPARARTDGVPLGRAIRDRLVRPLLPEFLKRLARRRPRALDAWALDARDGFERYLAPAMVAPVRQRRLPPILQSNSPAERVLALAGHHIPSRCTFHAIMAARHGLSVSFPLLDRRVVDFMLSLPLHYFLAAGQARQPFRRAMTGILPEPVRRARHKVGLFDSRLAECALRKPALLATLASLRASSRPVVGAMFDLDAIEAGLQALPTPDQAPHLVRSQPGTLATGQRPAQLMIAVHCLIAADQLNRSEVVARE